MRDSDRVALIDSRGPRVLTEKLRNARFRLLVIPGRYTIELLGDGKQIHDRILQRQKLSVGTPNITVRFRFAAP